ncbi:LOW QUALITY PROTEIN: uncharacterized protein LJ206_013111 [Theristicus caerulescens]
MGFPVTVFSYPSPSCRTSPWALRTDWHTLTTGPKNGSNAAMAAAVAVAAALSVTEPVSAGVGGDCFCLYWDANIKCMHGLKGSFEKLTLFCFQSIDMRGGAFFVFLSQPPPNHLAVMKFALDMGHNTADLHVLTEAMKPSFTDAFSICADPDKVLVPRKSLTERVYFTVVDPQGNACVFIKCNCMGFGTGLLALGKHPYHTISPTLAIAADSEALLCSFGVMGEFMQPQGQVQVMCFLMLEFGMNPQQALAAAWLCLNSSERGIILI